MKTILIMMIALTSSLVFAGNGSGTLKSAAAAKQDVKIDIRADLVAGNGSGTIRRATEIIYNMGQNQEGTVKFAYGQLVENQWQVQKLEMPKVEILKDPAVMKALQDSVKLNNWAPIEQ